MSSSLPQKSLPISDCPLPIWSSSFGLCHCGNKPSIPKSKNQSARPAKIGNPDLSGSEIVNNFPWLNQHKLGRESY